jgi:Transglutaminase-like superfamily
LRKIKKWIVLPKLERRFFARLILLMPVVWVGLRVVGFVRVHRWVERGSDARGADQYSTPIDPETMSRLSRYGALSSAAARLGVVKASCLVQSLALCRALNRMGYPSKVRLGVKSTATPFVAHAWVEYRGVPIGEPVDDYAAFPEPLWRGHVE